MDKKIFICAAIILFFAVIGALAYNYLETYTITRNLNPNREARRNNFLAMERWLRKTGLSFRSNESININKLSDVKDKVVILNSWINVWGNTDEIIPWVIKGGCLVLCLDDFNLKKSETFLSGFGVKIIETDYLNKNVITSPVSFSSYLSFEILELESGFNTKNINTIIDDDDIIRLVEIPLGNGMITVLGEPIFMYNHFIEEKENAYLTWRLTGEQIIDNNKSILFIRPYDTNLSKGLFGTIMEKGNLIPLIVSMFILIFIGFWMVIPGFGLVFAYKQRNSRPIKDRFAAEIRFLKKHNALDYYLSEHKHTNESEEDENKTNKYNLHDLINKYRRVFNEKARI